MKKYLAYVLVVACFSALPGHAQEVVQVEQTDYEYAIQISGGRLSGHEGVAKYVNDVADKLGHQTEVDVAVLSTSVLEAWQVGPGELAVSRGLLLALDTEAELAAILAHELAHADAAVIGSSTLRDKYRKRPIASYWPALASPANYAMGMAVSGVEHIYRKYPSVKELVADLVTQEILAGAGYSPAAVVDLQEKLLALSLDETHPYLLSHVPGPARIKQATGNSARLEAKLQKPGWRIGKEDYQSAIRSLRSGQKAYQQFDRAMAADDADAALASVNAAIELFSADAAFYSLKGEILMNLDQLQASMAAYEKAVEMEPDNYGYQLGLAMALSAQGDREAAREKLSISQNLLPNAFAVRALAAVSSESGLARDAKQLYLSLMQEKGHLASLGQSEFVRIHMMEEPHAYFLTQTFIREGEVRTIVTNQSGHDVAGLEVQFDAKVNDEDWQEIVSVGPLGANKQTRLFPGWQVSDEDTLENIYVRVIRIIK